MKKVLLFIICFIGAMHVGIAQQGLNCEGIYSAAEFYYNAGKYADAAKMYQNVVDNCQGEYGGAAARLAECRRKVAETDEEAAYNECRNSNSPTVLQSFLTRFPNSRHAAEIRQKMNNLMAQWASANETTRENIAYSRCNTVAACDEYLANYPNGRYVTEVLNKKHELEHAIDDRLQRQREREEAEETAYMANIRVEFGNAYDINGSRVKDDFGSTLYAADMRFLVPKLSYKGRLRDEREVAVLYCRFLRPDGTLMNSFTNGFYVDPGNNYTLLAGFGNSEASVFDPGTYQFELWYNGSLLYNTSVTLNNKDYALSSDGWRRALSRCLEVYTEAYDEGLYKGCLNAGERSKMGVYYWNTGTCYFGNWNHGERDCWGILIVREGYEVSNCPDCAYFVGQFSNGVKMGEGTCYDRAGNLIYYGDFTDDRPTGTYPMSGYGNYKFICIEKGSGNYYLGEVENELPDGKGIYMQRDGDMWFGAWTGGYRDGKVFYLPYDGTPVIERWSKGEKKQ